LTKMKRAFKKAENTSITVNRALDILGVFLEREGGLSLSEISDATGLNAATAYRLLSTLAGRGYLRQHEKKATYSLGLKMLDFHCAVRRDLKFIDLAYLSMSRLSKEYNQSVYLAAVDADSALVIEEVGITEDLRINSPVGKRLPLHCTACGKVLLASLTEEQRRAYYARNPLGSLTSNTITNVDSLEEELVKVKSEGVAFDNEEYRMGLWIAAAPVYNGNGDIMAAAGIMVPTSEVDASTARKFGTAIKSCAAMISQAVARIS
jgi:DNA-binding IclR family transcriptional regulator